MLNNFIMEKIVLFVLIFFAISLGVPTQEALAHVLKTDGSVGAVIHINPEDDPIAGQESGFYFEFKDTKNAFSPEKCNCVFSIKENGKELNSQSLFQNSTNPSLEDVSVYYTFPQRGVYTVGITGTPITPEDFEPFTLSWDIRVEREAQTSAAQETSSSNDQNIKYIVLVGAVVIIVGLVLSKKKKTAQ